MFSPYTRVQTHRGYATPQTLPYSSSIDYTDRAEHTSTACITAYDSLITVFTVLYNGDDSKEAVWRVRKSVLAPIREMNVVDIIPITKLSVIRRLSIASSVSAPG